MKSFRFLSLVFALSVSTASFAIGWDSVTLAPMDSWDSGSCHSNCRPGYNNGYATLNEYCDPRRPCAPGLECNLWHGNGRWGYCELNRNNRDGWHDGWNHHDRWDRHDGWRRGPWGR